MEEPSFLDILCPRCGRSNPAKGEAGFQRVECMCGNPIFVLVGDTGAAGTPPYSLLQFDILRFAQFLKDTRKPVEIFNLQSGLLYSGCDRAYVYSTGLVDAMPMAKAKINKWIREFLITGRA
jgi:hypothetical protein